MQQVTIKGEHHPGRAFQYEGWLVPDTDGLLAVDERYPGVPDEHPASWYITHLPTAFAVYKAGYTEADTQEQAVGMAQRFFREWQRRGWDLNTSNVESISGPHNAMSAAEKDVFWKAVRGELSEVEQ